MIKPIENRKERERRERRNRIIVGFIMVFLMVVSVIGFALNLRGNNQEKQGGFWEFPIKLGGQQIIVRTVYLPNETKIIPAEKVSLQEFLNQKFYFYANQKLRQNAVRLLTYLSYFSLLNEACLKGEECYNNELPLKTCDSNFIFFNYSNETSIEKNKNCLIINANETTIDLAIDRLLFDIFEIEK